ncbi:MAG: hypothetical protein Q7V53_02895 [Caldisericota bacterium]|nr:hypothetical protein [Caldisericota bacterium]
MKQRLLDDGIVLMRRFCEVNSLAVPEVNIRSTAEWPFGVCAYYRPTKIEVCLEKCAHIGVAGRSWSFPGNTVDRTPYGVIQHELGHHVDVMHSTQTARYRGDFSVKLRREAGEPPISGYCPDDGEWFAELFRVFVTNPDLLRIIRPATYERLRSRFDPVVADSWEAVLSGAPDRTKAACSKKVGDVLRRHATPQFAAMADSER